MKKVFCILLTLLLLAVLAVPAFAASIYESYVIPKGSVRMVAHRGYSAVAPETDTKVPTLTEYLDVCKEYNMHPVIEIKECAPAESMEALAALLCAREEKEMFTIITFGKAQAARIKQLMPETPVYLLIGGVPAEQFPEAVQFCLDNGLDGLDFASVWGRKEVRMVQKAGLKTMNWSRKKKCSSPN